jgi:tetratricopeptide (TPR) repeat protein
MPANPERSVKEDVPMRTFRLAIVLMLVLATPLVRPVEGQGPPAAKLPARSFESCVPSSALAFFSVPDSARSEEQFRRTSLFELWREPEVQAFLRDAVRKVETECKKLLETLKIPDDACERFALGELALCVGAGDASSPHAWNVAFGIQVRNDVAGFRTVVDSVMSSGAELLASATGGAAVVREERQYGGCSIGSLVVRGGDLELCYTMMDGLFIGSLSRGYLERIIDAAKGPKGGVLASDPVFQSVGKKLRAASEKTLLFGFINLQALRTRFENLIPPDVMKIIKSLGLDLIQAIAFCESVEGKDLRDVFYVHAPGERRGLLRLASLARNPLATARLAPRDSVFFDSNTLDLLATLDEALGVLKAADPKVHESVAAGLQRIDAALGFRLREDLLPALGGETGTFVSFGAAGVIPDVGLVLKAKDPAAIRRCLDAIPFDKLGLQARRLEFGGTTMTYLDLSTYKAPFSPAFCVSGDFLLAGGSVQTVKQMVARQTSADEGLLGNAEFQALRAKLPRDASWIEFVDLRRAASLLASTVAPMLASIPRQQQLPVDPLLFPTAETLSKHLGGSLSHYRSDTEGFFSECESSIGSGFLFVLAGAGASLLRAPGSPAMGTSLTPRELAARDRIAGRYESAVHHLTRAIESSPSEASLFFERGTAYHALKRYARAREDLERAAKAGHFPYLCHYWIARAHALEGDREAAIRSLEQAVNAGYPRSQEWASEGDFISLREDARFRAWTSPR